MSSDSKNYHHWQEDQEKKWEALCTQCGACCGSVEGDPCEYLFQNPDGKYFCGIYDNRFGYHQSISGKELQCVPVRNILHESWPGDNHCGYKRNLD